MSREDLAYEAERDKRAAEYDQHTRHPSSKQETLEQRVRESGDLFARLEDCRRRIGKMCSELRSPRMSIPVEWTDDDFFISVTIKDAIETLTRAAQNASAGETETPQAPIAKVIVREDGPADVMLYAPGLPPGTHDLYCEPPSPGGQKVPHPCFAPETKAPLDSDFSIALARCGVREPLEVYTSNSYRRVGLKSQYSVVLHATRHNDGTLDISNTTLLEALVAAFNAMLARHSQVKTGACSHPAWTGLRAWKCDLCGELRAPDVGGD
jgi:hypothetical protein